MDRIGADFFRGLEMMVDRLGANPVALQVPIGRESDFRGIIDLIEMNAIVYVDELGTDCEVVDIPDEHARRGRRVPAQARRGGRRPRRPPARDLPRRRRDHARRTCARSSVARRSTSASRRCSAARASRTRACSRSWTRSSTYLPSPLDVPPVTRHAAPTAPRSTRKAEDDGTLRGPRLQGRRPTRTSASSPTSASTRARSRPGRTSSTRRKQKRERISRILQMHANHREDRDEVYAGEIAAAVGLKVTEHRRHALRPGQAGDPGGAWSFPSPSSGSRSSPRPRPTRRSSRPSLQKLAEEDPTFRVRTDEETGQTIIAGMGELHLEIIVDRLTREFNVDANVGRPQVAYRETVRGAAHKVEGRFVRQTGGRGQYGHVVIDLERNEPGDGYEFESRIVGGSIPREYIPAVDEGIQEAMNTGVLAGYPDGRPQGRAHRRQLPRGRLVRHGLQDRRLAGVQGGGAEGQADPPRAHDGGRGRHPGRVHGRRDGRPQLAPRPRRRHGAARQRPGRSAPRCRSRPCSGTPPIVRSTTQGRATYTMQFKHYPKCRRRSPRRSSRRCAARDAAGSPHEPRGRRREKTFALAARGWGILPALGAAGRRTVFA